MPTISLHLPSTLYAAPRRSLIDVPLHDLQIMFLGVPTGRINLILDTLTPLVP